jgi:hypothetical protein
MFNKEYCRMCVLFSYVIHICIVETDEVKKQEDKNAIDFSAIAAGDFLEIASCKTWFDRPSQAEHWWGNSGKLMIGIPKLKV